MFLLVRDCLYQPNPPVLDILPHGTIAGEVTLDREQSDRQAALGLSFYIVDGKHFRLFVGLRSYSDDLSKGNYYWLLFFADDTIHMPGHWTSTASKEELLFFVNNTTKDIHPDFKEILQYQKVENILKPFIVRDRLPEICPPGPVTLIGDATHPMSPCEST